MDVDADADNTTRTSFAHTLVQNIPWPQTLKMLVRLDLEAHSHCKNQYVVFIRGLAGYRLRGCLNIVNGPGMLATFEERYECHEEPQRGMQTTTVNTNRGTPYANMGRNKNTLCGIMQKLRLVPTIWPRLKLSTRHGH
eukprot:7446929-Lingulodinium_polyedra.AAC.1